MSSGNIPVWVLFAQNKTELYREVRRVYAGQSDQLEARPGFLDIQQFHMVT